MCNNLYHFLSDILIILDKYVRHIWISVERNQERNHIVIFDIQKIYSTKKIFFLVGLGVLWFVLICFLVCFDLFFGLF